MRRGLVVIWPAVLLLALVMACACGPSDAELSQVGHPDWPADLQEWAAKARAEFTGVPVLSVADLDTRADGAVIVDVRTADEIAVSRIPGALDLSDGERQDRFVAQPPDGPVIVYCTAGWRSGEYARRLRAAGVDAFNLEGGICAWAIDGRELVDEAGQPTLRIHTYDRSMAGCVPADHEAVTGR